MKAKPDLTQFQPKGNRAKKDPTSFLDGADPEVQADAPKRGPKAVTAPTVQKLFRLDAELAMALKRHVAEETIKTGKRITEIEIVDQALRNYLKIS
ncbi:hypothetical protein KYK30_31450 [Shinella yambaruensis]|uniref:Plasmid segregation centromere-binding protein ParG n=1 Tax=Shinella yambaruensis TaxID=415996 RepID=A0ABQ5ZQR6_9HYPH|nr:hypothetical protein [Shinella yambaruensis]MCJ8029962.1 hypothetical protein [Shinella yambaruensis]MCU7984240.1 hypothetical protein [Shinella yambaruensis]GLR55213.1 hypothetical protein GCM10007923_64350 [Shinella yambaruensis]